ncbi:RNA polymerase sigma factor [Streptomyces globisporus]|uniref:RNA polymerase sigma factor n=1 Tax=Streptomyces globisporus TaxID=1908 RepID=UPI00378CE82A
MAEEPLSATDAVEAMYAEKEKDLLAHARRCLAKEGIRESRIAAEDLVQDAIVVALTNYSKQPIENVAGYVYKVIANKARDEGRRIGVAQPIDANHHTVDQDRFIHVSAVEEVGPEGVADHLDLEDALLTLPGQQQRMVVLAKGFDYTHAEIADITGLHKGTIAQHIRRGTRALTILLTGVASCLTFALFACFASFGGEDLVPAGSHEIRAALRKFDGYSPWVTTLAVLALGGLLGLVWILRAKVRRAAEVEVLPDTAALVRAMEKATNYGGALSNLGREPTDEEFARELDVTPELIHAVRRYMAELSTRNRPTRTRLASDEVGVPRAPRLPADDEE